MDTTFIQPLINPISILLVTSSSDGHSIAFRWPPDPKRQHRIKAPSWKTTKESAVYDGWGGELRLVREELEGVMGRKGKQGQGKEALAQLSQGNR